MKSIKYSDIAGHYGAILSLVEIGLGSFLHGFKLPFSGQLLSLNQGFFLTRAAWKNRLEERDIKAVVLQISLISALLKSLSPAGKKLTPMLAITAQGFFFYLGIQLFGINLFGLMIAMTLLALWAFIQPLLIYSMLYGSGMVAIGEHYLKMLQEVFPIQANDLLFCLLFLILFKVILGLALTILAMGLKDEYFEKFQNRLIHLGKKQRQQRVALAQKNLTLKSPVKMAWSDLWNWPFIITWLMTIFFFFFSQHDKAQTFWLILRPLAIGFLMFYAIRLIPLEKLIKKIEHSRFKKFAESLRSAIETIQR